MESAAELGWERKRICKNATTFHLFRMRRAFRIAFALRDAESTIGRELFLGAYGVANRSLEWKVVRVDDTGILSWHEALKMKPDGILGVLNSRDCIGRREIGRSRVIVLNAALEDHAFHRVISDSAEAGRRAASHLLERRLSKFAYVGASGLHFSELRRKGFLEALIQHGYSGALPSAESKDLTAFPKLFERWLLSLSMPCGILCANDSLAVQVIEVCQKLRLDVPHDLAIVSISNDEMSCIQCPVTLSSVAQNFRSVGHSAACLLKKWLSGEAAIPKVTLIPPGEVVERDSTRTFGIKDPLVRRALSLIRLQYQDPLQIEDLCSQMGNVSRRLLERRFHEALGISPHREILNHRIRAAQRLIRSTSLPFGEIALQSGFFDSAHFSRHFKNAIGLTPSQFRREFAVV